MSSRDSPARRAQRRLGRALLLAARGAAAARHGRLARYTWEDAYAELRQQLAALGRAIGGTYRVLVDANQHVDREAAARSGVGFYGKNTMLITRRHGSWVVLGTLVTDVELEATPPLDTDCGECRICIDACPTGALDEPGTLDATKCLSYWTQAPTPIPEEYRPELGAQVYGCDICQDVCPWNRGVEKRRADAEPSGAGHVDLVEWLESDDARRRLLPPVRAAERPAGFCAGTRSSHSGTSAARSISACSSSHADDEHARWAIDRIEGRAGQDAADGPTLRPRAWGAVRPRAARARSATSGPQFSRFEHDRLTAIGDDLSDQPLGAADRLVGDRGAVDERAGALLDLPASDRRRVPDARGGGGVEL